MDSYMMKSSVSFFLMFVIEIAYWLCMSEQDNRRLIGLAQLIYKAPCVWWVGQLDYDFQYDDVGSSCDV